MPGIVPLDAFDPAELSMRIQPIVDASRTHLAEERYFPGVVNRFGGTALQASTFIGRALDDHKIDSRFFAYAVVEGDPKSPEDGASRSITDVVGLATIQYRYKVCLQSLRLPLPPRLLERAGLGDTVLMRDRKDADPNIAAWVRPELVTDLLETTYAGLLTVVRKQYPKPSRRDIVQPLNPQKQPRAWTIEPLRAPDEVHEAIAASGLTPTKKGRFDDQEARRFGIPPRSQLYQDLPPSRTFPGDIQTSRSLGALDLGGQHMPHRGRWHS